MAGTSAAGRGWGCVKVVAEQKYMITYGLRRYDTMSNVVSEHKLE